MKVRMIETIPEDIYQKMYDLENVSFYHTMEWHQFLYKTFYWKVGAVLGFQEGDLLFFIPFISKRRVGIKKINICLPFSHKVGICYTKNGYYHLNDFLSQLKEIFTNLEIHDEIKQNNISKSHNVDITVLDLNRFTDSNDLYKSFDYTSIKYKINRAKKNNITIKTDLTEENFDIFYNLEVATRKRQGSPIYPKSFFKKLCKTFKDTNLISIYIAFYNNKPISGAVFFSFKDRTIYAYSASVNENKLKKLGASELIMWDALRDSMDNGIRYFDFGTTPVFQKSLKKFKEKWGGISYAFPYSYLTTEEKGVKKIKRDGALITIASSILKNLPTPLFKIVGPLILKRVI